MPSKMVKEEHICPDGSRGQIWLTVREKRWYWHVYGFQLKVLYCPQCGEKLEQPNA